MFFKASILKCIAKFTEKTCTVVFLFNKAAGFLLKRDSGAGVSTEFYQIFKNISFVVHLWSAPLVKNTECEKKTSLPNFILATNNQ